MVSFVRSCSHLRVSFPSTDLGPFFYSGEVMLDGAKGEEKAGNRRKHRDWHKDCRFYV